MNNLNEILSSGIIDEYCLGLLSEEENLKMEEYAIKYPEVSQAIEMTLEALQKYSKVRPDNNVKEKIINVWTQLKKEESLSLQDYPVLSKYSDLAVWQNALKDAKPTEEYESLKLNYLIDSPDHQLCLAWLESELSEEPHETRDFRESFFILEGSCMCDIGGKIVHLKAGDFLEIPFGVHHTIKNTSEDLPYVKALIQRIAA